MEETYKLDGLIKASASILDIIAASGSRHFPEEVIKCHIISCVMFHF